MQKIIPNLWFDTQAMEAAEFYSSIFPDSKIKDTVTLKDTPSGDALMITAEFAGFEFLLLNGGPFFKPNPSVSFMVTCDTTSEVEKLWKSFADGGTALMELGSYPFSKKYGWIQDKYGFSWQIMFMDNRPITQKITPTLMFVGNNCGQAEAAINFYASTFHDTKIGDIMRYEAGDGPDKAGTIKHADFTLEGQKFAAMDSALDHKFAFNEAISLIVNCDDQKEIDYFWEKLSAVPEAEQCGWLKDKYGLSWQITPTAMTEMLNDSDPEKTARVTQALLKMKKLDLKALNQAALK